MKKHLKKVNRNAVSLGDLIMAVSSSAKDPRETLAALSDMMDSGMVRINTNGSKVRARLVW